MSISDLNYLHVDISSFSVDKNINKQPKSASNDVVVDSNTLDWPLCALWFYRNRAPLLNG